jgi:Thiolase, N-terminal domain
MHCSCSTQKNPDDVVITLAIRTPLTKAVKGGFKDTDLDYIVYALLKKVAEKSNLDPSVVEDVCLGNVSMIQLRYGFLMTSDRYPMAKPHILSVQPCSQLAFHTLRAPHPLTVSVPRVSRLFKILRIRSAWEA